MLTYTNEELRRMLQYPLSPWELEKLVATVERLLDDNKTLEDEAQAMRRGCLEEARRELKRLRGESQGTPSGTWKAVNVCVPGDAVAVCT